MLDLWNNLLGGFATAGTPINLLWALAGCALGTAIGVLPGLGPAVTVAMLLPITGQVEATASMIFFAGIYYGAMYGGSTTSILLNTPGETGTMVTALEGFKMAKNGRAGAALATSAIGSFVAGTIATILVTLFAPFLAEFAVKLGPPEYFCLMLLAFTTVSAVLGQSTLRGITALFFGLALGLVGMAQITGQVRYTGGVIEFMVGVEVVLVAVGLFAVTEALYNALYEGKSATSMNKMNKAHMTRSEWKRSWPAWLRGTFIGFPFGTIPAGGSEIPTFLSYATERKLADPAHKKEFGTTVSKEHNPESNPNYWFAFHPHQQTFLEKHALAYVAFGCGTSERLVLVPYEKFKPWLQNTWVTENGERTYWHVVIYRDDKKYALRLKKGSKAIDLTPYVVAGGV
jgi:putative tricarboxylic transport membrane protein